MESVYLLFVAFVIIGDTAPVTEAGILDPIRNMFSPVGSRSQSRQDLDKLFSRLRVNSETLDAIDPTDFHSNNPTVTADPDYPQTQFDSYQDQGYRPFGQTLLNIANLVKTTPARPKPPVECKKKPKEKKPLPKCPKPPPECPKPPPECPKPPPECPKPPPECPKPPPECPKPPPECPKPPPECPKPPPECPKPPPECPKPCPECPKLPPECPTPPPECPKPPPDCPKPPPECPKPPPECPKPPPECPKPPLECPKPPPECLDNSIESGLKAIYRDKYKLYKSARLPFLSPYKQEIPSNAVSNSELSSNDPHNSKLPTDPLISNSRLPFDGPFDSQLPFDGLSNSEFPSDDPYNSELPSDGPYNSELPSNGQYNSNFPSDGQYNSNLSSDRLSSLKILSDGRSYSGLPPNKLPPNNSRLPNDGDSKSRWDIDEPNSKTLDDIIDTVTVENNNMLSEENREFQVTTSKEITQADYDNIVAKNFPAAAKLLDVLNKLKELHKMNENNENNEDDNIHKNVNKNDNTGNGRNNEYFKATPRLSTVKPNIKFNNRDINALLHPKGVYMRITTSPNVNGIRPVMRKVIKRRFIKRDRLS